MDILAAMPRADEVENSGTLGNGQSLLGNDWFSNQAKVIKRCGNYERHKQNLRAHSMALLGNMFSNFIQSESIDVATVRSQSQIEELLSGMMEVRRPLVLRGEYKAKPTFSLLEMQ